MAANWFEATQEGYRLDIQKGRSKVDRRIGNNTTVRVENKGTSQEAYVIRLHKTDIITIYRDRAVLNTGGWQTVTTKSRLNDLTTARVWQEKGEWFFSYKDSGKQRWVDNVTIKADGSIMWPNSNRE